MRQSVAQPFPPMNESEFHRAVDEVLARIERAAEATQGIDSDLEAGILTLECPDGSRIIVNRQTPNREIWVAARSGRLPLRVEGRRLARHALRRGALRLARGNRARAGGREPLLRLISAAARPAFPGQVSTRHETSGLQILDFVVSTRY